MNVDLTLVISILGVAGIFAPVVLKISTRRAIADEMSCIEQKLDDYNTRLVKLEENRGNAEETIKELKAALSIVDKKVTRIFQILSDTRKPENVRIV